MGPKYKVTGCARFFVFLVLFVPAVFFGAAYYRGENGVQIIKDFFQSIVGGGSSTESKERKEETYSSDDLKEKLEAREEEIQRLRKELEAKEKEIEKLKSGQ
jgi:Skp family chaperone for outer membrane proteins